MSEEKETWNMADATLRRFDFFLQQCTLFSQTGDLKRWFYVLRDMKTNLFPFMTDGQYKDITSKLNSIPPNWINPNGTLNRQLFEKVYSLFEEIQMDCLFVMKHKGLLMPKPININKSIVDM